MDDLSTGKLYLCGVSSLRENYNCAYNVAVGHIHWIHELLDG